MSKSSSGIKSKSCPSGEEAPGRAPGGPPEGLSKQQVDQYLQMALEFAKADPDYVRKLEEAIDLLENQ